MYDEDDGFPNTAPVGSFPKGKSRYGIQDVVGNVWEWVADWYADYDTATATRDRDGSRRARRRGPSASSAAARGTARSHPGCGLPSAFTSRPPPRSYGIGFRCAKSL